MIRISAEKRAGLDRALAEHAERQRRLATCARCKHFGRLYMVDCSLATREGCDACGFFIWRPNA